VSLVRQREFHLSSSLQRCNGTISTVHTKFVIFLKWFKIRIVERMSHYDSSSETDSVVHAASIYLINPQNAQDDVNPPNVGYKVSDEAVITKQQGMQRIGGVLVPIELAQTASAELSVPPKRCSLCTRKGSIRKSRNREGLLQVTICEVKQHNTLQDCWITCKGYVYSATAFMSEDEHPGGERAFMRRAGGKVDCAEDYAFHSNKGRKLWSKYRIATIVKCEDDGEDEDSGGCTIS
jgi:cytochrome b involved in lipid metabolism